MTSHPPSYRSMSLPPLEEESTCITTLSQIEGLRPSLSALTPCFTVIQGPSTGEMHKLAQGETILGRSQQATIRVNDDGISRKHIRVWVEGANVDIEDLGSANGTFIEAAQVMKRRLKDGDKIRLGTTTVLKFSYADSVDANFQEQMYEAALRDALTKAFNKKYFIDRLESEFAFAKRHRTPLSVIMIDIDFFKKVNDTYGHLAGDAALVSVAKAAGALVRTEDVFARYGGEEFGIVCRGTLGKNASILGERVRSAVERHVFVWEGQRIPLTVSAGIACFPEYNANTELELLGRADEGLYASKHAGRNRVTLL